MKAVKEKTNWKNSILELENINTDFIHLSPTILQQSAFKTISSYNSRVEPKLIDFFDYQTHRKETIEKANKFIEANHKKLSKCKSIYEKIFFIMETIYFRNGTLKQTRYPENRNIFQPILERCISNNTPLEFLLPSFPFKVGNPIKAMRNAPDMAEVLCLSRLYEFCLAIKYIYPPGAKFIIISDGQIYHDIFGATLYEALYYKEKSIQMIYSLGFEDNLEMIDMQNLINQRKQEFDDCRKQLRPIFEKWWTQKDEDLKILALINATTININMNNVIHDLIQVATKDMMHKFDEAGHIQYIKKVREEIYNQADRAAFEFSLFLYTLKELDLVLGAYPNAIRATVHPKPKQWGIHLVNKESRIFPWHGVAYKKKNGKWRMKLEYELIRNNSIPVYINGELSPFYYEEVDESIPK
ncbi:L-tyrosine/L-tryptophan isonitrile synthase family protein [Bacillus mycoides]|uniref:L-tyrosine/L-tryptophan isonitrile synthase family protein n=1 Tax=Bacillus mycoides TaxID=1405 RepID=UPI000BFE0039|nr:L-tyrosine/L-tryptophan isonitrile synthase family protein [Bacillus mycoides]MCQ6530328.1 isocyanide synthase family protein [Bacillus mycoides]PGT77829.1 hypothetical protein COD14_06975 [Bacillus cereus]